MSVDERVADAGRGQGTRPRAVVYGCAGPELGADERAFFRDADPMGFILFRRNVQDPDQVRRLVEALRDSVGDPERPILIDQEGGRVARLRPPIWPEHPPARTIGRLHERDPERGREAARLNGRLLGRMLSSLGITIDCAPVADVAAPGAHDVIGDRAFGGDAAAVAELARETCAGLLDERVLPVIKHLPGHGRAEADSHLELPVVAASHALLSAVDFAPFRALGDMPLGMTAHIVFRALDPDRPATQSPTVIGEVIRGEIGFEGLLFSDDLSMNALTGGMKIRAGAALAAGCDVILHCNGDMKEMTALADVIPTLSDAALVRWERAETLRRSGTAGGIGDNDLRERLAALLAAPDGWGPVA